MIRISLVPLLVFAICACCIAQPSSTETLAIISNPHATTNELAKALITLRDSKQTNEPAAFWTAIANDSKFSCEQRSIAVLQLVRRHFHPGMTFADVGKLFEHPNWIDSKCLGGAPVSGPRPPHFRSEDGMAYVCVKPCESNSLTFLYFRFTHGSMGSLDDLYQCLTGNTENRDVAAVKIDEIVSGEFIGNVEVYNAWGIKPTVVGFGKAGELGPEVK